MQTAHFELTILVLQSPLLQFPVSLVQGFALSLQFFHPVGLFLALPLPGRSLPSVLAAVLFSKAELVDFLHLPQLLDWAALLPQVQHLEVQVVDLLLVSDGFLVQLLVLLLPLSSLLLDG